MKKFSLMVNSRNRPQHLEKLLDSIVETTNDLSSIEVIIKLDKCDPTLLQSLEVLNKYSFSNYLVSPRPDNQSISLAKISGLAIGYYLFVLNDDVLFMSKHWDTLAYDALSDYHNKFPDGIVYGHTHDLSIDKDESIEYAAFPIISKTAFEVLGFFAPTEIYGLGGDVATYEIYKKVGRVLPLKNIILKHTLHQTKEQVMNPDQTAYEMRVRTYNNRQSNESFNAMFYANKLQEYIKYGYKE